jgi:putative intracellular protease/amidase
MGHLVHGPDPVLLANMRIRPPVFPQAMTKVTESLPLSSVDAATFDAVFLPGGHGVCFDLPNSETLQKQLSAAYTSGKVG